MPATNPFIATENPTPEQIKAAQLQAIVIRINAGGAQLLRQVIQFITANWDHVWQNPSHTPAEIIAAMGPNAVEIFRTSAILTAAVYEIGASAPTPTVLLDPKYLSAKLPWTGHEDGTITLNS